MNRKLHNTILAFSFTGLAVVLMLLAASPVPQAGGDTVAYLTGCNHGAAATAIGTAAVLATADAATAGHGTRTAPATVDQDDAQTPRRARRRHQALAMPYFSFAQGLRPVGS